MRFAIAFLPLLAFLLSATACGIVGGSSSPPTPTPTATYTPTSTPTATPSPTPTPVPQLEQPIELSQGRAAVVHVTSGAGSATASFNGQTFALLHSTGGFWGVIGVEASQGAGQYPITVSLSDPAGRPAGELSGTVAVYTTDFPVEQIYLPPDQNSLLGPDLAAQEAATRASVFATSTPDRLWSGTFIYPVQAPITDPYGVFRGYNGGPATTYHHGTDFGVDEGTPLVASNAGRVAFVGALPVRGNSVIIDHGAGVFSAYHHLQSATVQVGQVVAKGDLIAYSGKTGLATGPHLHWEIIVRGVNVDPVYWTQTAYGP
jgi:murein DD-endopeptidase MepM/ murein hydrolase activator NlpD